MKPAPLSFAVLGNHDRSGFTCGNAALDRYFQEQVTQDMRRNVCVCVVGLREQQIVGFYTLAPAQVSLSSLPEKLRKKLPRVPVPCYRIGRLAVARTFQKQGIGADLLFDAITRTWQTDIPAVAVIVDAKDEKAKAFYQHLGFTAFEDEPLSLFLKIARVKCEE